MAKVMTLAERDFRSVLTGKTVVVTGDFKPFADRKGMEAFLFATGAKVGRKVDTRTDYLLDGASNRSKLSSKAIAADNLGVPVISFADFEAMFGHYFEWGA